MEWVKPMLRFGDPFDCDREFKCFHCKLPVNKGEKILYEFSQRHRYHEKCAQEVAEDQKETPVIVSLSPETIKAFAELCKVKEPAKPGLFSDRMPLGMNAEQTKAFNALLARTDRIEKRQEAIEARLKEVTGE